MISPLTRCLPYVDLPNFLYDFTPDSLSAIRGLADKDYSKIFPIDRKGISRLADGEPDAGAYEYVKP